MHDSSVILTEINRRYGVISTITGKGGNNYIFSRTSKIRLGVLRHFYPFLRARYPHFGRERGGGARHLELGDTNGLPK